MNNFITAFITMNEKKKKINVVADKVYFGTHGNFFFFTS